MTSEPRKRPQTPAQSSDVHADRHDLIRVHGARVNNLKDVSVEIPKRRLTVFTGVSGSGKSSLVFGTIAAESQRLINETYSAFVQGFMPTLGRPDVDVLEGLTTAIIVDQERMGANPRSTVGTATDANAMLRIVFSRLGQPHIGSPQAFSFNTATISGAGAVTFEKGGKKVREKRSFTRTGGMCPRCEGMGSVTDFDLTELYDDTKSLNEGALTIPGYSMDGWYGRIFRGCGYFDPDKPISKFTKKELDDLLYKEPTKIKVDGINLTYAGLIPKIQKSMLSKDVEAMQPHIRAFVERVVTFTDVPRLRRHPAQRGGPVVEDRRDQHRRRLRDADQRPGRVGARPRRAVGGAAARVAGADARLVRRDRARLPLARPAVGHAVGRRGAAHQDDPPPRVVAHRRHLRVRRADGRAAPARHRADERPAAAAARQGQHRARRRAQAGDDRDRRPRRRPRPRRRHRRRRGRVRGHRRGAAGQRHASPAATSTTAPRSRTTVRTPTGALEVRGADTNNLQDVDVDIPLGVLVVAHRRGRVGQELADHTARSRGATAWCRSTRRRSRARGAATRRPTPGCSTRSARRSPRPTA